MFPNLGSVEFWAPAVAAAAVFFRPLVSGVAYSWSNAYFQTAAVLSALLLLLAYFKGGRGLYLPRAGIFLAAFVFWAGVSTAFSVYRAASLRELFNLFGYAALFFVAADVSKRGEKRNILLVWLFASAAVVSVYAAYQYYWGLERTREAVGHIEGVEFVPEFMSRLLTQRAFSTFVYPPALAGFLAAVIPAVSGMALSEKKPVKKALFALCAVLCLFALVLTYSKGGWLAAVASGIFFAGAWMKYIRGKIHLPSVIAAAVLVLALAGAVLTGVDRRATARGFVASYTVRHMYWLAAPGIMSDYPVTGSGPGTWGAVYPEHKALEAGETQMAHNNYVQVAAETGVAGLLLLVLFFAASSAPAFRALRRKNVSREEAFTRLGLLSGLVAFWVQSLGEFTLYIPGAAAAAFLFAGTLSTGDARERKPALSAGGGVLASACAVLFAGFLVFVFRMPMLGDRYYERAQRSMEEGDLISSDFLLSKAVRAFPLEARYYFRRGQAREARPGFLSAAISDYEEAARHNPHSSAVYSRLARALWARSGGRDNRDRERALFFMEQAVKRYPYSSIYRLSLGRMYQLSGMDEKARREYLLAIEYSPGETMESRREILEERLDDARKWLEELEM